MATFTNQATLTYNGQTTTSNVTVGELAETLTAAKTAVVPTYGTGRPRDVRPLAGQQRRRPADGADRHRRSGRLRLQRRDGVSPVSYTAGSVRYYQNGVLQAAPAVTAGAAACRSPASPCRRAAMR